MSTTAASDTEALSSMGFTIKANNLKIACSKLVVDIVSQAMLICGISGTSTTRNTRSGATCAMPMVRR